jgi:hypothetical protein
MKHISQIIAEMMAAGKLPVVEYRTDSSVGAVAARPGKAVSTPCGHAASLAGANARQVGSKKTT